MATNSFNDIGAEIAEVQSVPDPNANRELKEFGGGDDFRKEQAKQILHESFLLFVRVAAFAFIALFVVRMGHFMLPDAWCWLDEKKVQAIDKSLFSGAIGGLVMNYIKQAFPTLKKD